MAAHALAGFPADLQRDVTPSFERWLESPEQPCKIAFLIPIMHSPLALFLRMGAVFLCSASAALAATTPPQIKNAVTPEHPQDLMDRGISGRAKLAFVVTEEGTVADPQVVVVVAHDVVEDHEVREQDLVHPPDGLECVQVVARRGVAGKDDVNAESASDDPLEAGWRRGEGSSNGRQRTGESQPDDGERLLKRVEVSASSDRF